MRPLIEAGKYRDALKPIKKMQIILGDFHDFQVQGSLLVSIAKDPAFQKKKRQKTIILLVKKIQKLEEKQEKKFRKKFIAFKAHEKQFRKLFEVY